MLERLHAVPFSLLEFLKNPAFLEKQKTLGCTRINVGFCYCTCARFPESLLVSLFQSQLCLAEGKGGFDPKTADL